MIKFAIPTCVQEQSSSSSTWPLTLPVVAVTHPRRSGWRMVVDIQSDAVARRADQVRACRERAGGRGATGSPMRCWATSTSARLGHRVITAYLSVSEAVSSTDTVLDS
jgi:hypothetical protein